MDAVKLTIDGIPIEARRGEKVLWAALDNGIYIPNLCAIRQAEEPHAGCRLCFVEIEGWPKPVTACTEPVAEGMAVHTDAPQARRLRRTAAELLIAAECPDCAACAKNRHCELQRIAAHLGLKLKPKRLRGMPKSLPIDPSNPFFIRDPNKCVLCGKCVWACCQVVGADAIDFTFRGFDTHLRTFDVEPLIDERCESCGECVAICPVAALVEKRLRWPKREVKSICPYCAVGCGLYLGSDGSSIVSVRGDEESPVSRGSLCAKGRFGIADFVHHPQRLTCPLVRRRGRLVEASWEEAIDLVASGFARHRGDRFALISSAKATNEDNYLLQKFGRVVMGSNNIDNSSRLCDAPSLTALGQSLGSSAMTNPIADIEGAACIFVIGTNPTSSHPIVGYGIRRAARGGAKLIVANPRRIDLCRHSSLWLRNRPGGDLALLLGMMRVIVEEGLEDRPFIEERCENFDAFARSVMDLDPDTVAHASGVPRQQIREAARIYASHMPATILYASGLTQQARGTENVLALADLAMLTGNLGKAGSGLNPLKGHNNAQGACDMGALPDLLPGYQPIAEPEERGRFEAAWGYPLNPKPGLTLGEMLEAAYHGGIKALYIVGANPALNMANGQYVKEALSRLRFLVVQDMFLSETARLAHVVLPAASFAEKEGTFTNSERRVQLVSRAIDPVGDSRPDWWIVCQLARRMGASGFDFKRPSQIMQEIARLLPSYGGISHARLAEGGIQVPCPTTDHPGTPVLYARSFARGKGRFVPIEYGPTPELADDDYPLILTSERSLYHLGGMSRKVEGLNTLRGDELVEINPADALSLGLKDCQGVRVISRRGEVRAKTKITEATPPGVLFMSFHFGESPANLLTDWTLEPASKTPQLRLSAVRIEKIGGS